MKKHAIIPIFIPHKGCPNDCVFCNQRKITARTAPPSEKEVRNTIETWLSTLEPAGTDVIELAFFGGSFTGLPLEEQSAYLSIAKEYKDKRRIKKIHMSTRPDYIDETILNNLKKYDADTIELGVQSFDDEVLRLSGRGHDSASVYKSCRLIQEYDFELGIQLMIGLPGDTLEKDIYSAQETVKIRPSIARLYPTVIISDTQLHHLYVSGQYTPLSEEDAVHRTKEMYKILTKAGINIIRVGLKSSDILSDEDQTAGGTFHPAFRQLVEGAIAREQIEDQLKEYVTLKGRSNGKTKADFYANRRCFSNLIGNGGRNKKFFLEKYPELNILYKVNDFLQDYQYEVKIKENDNERNI
ncbi:elongator complex protein 3 [Ihubacter sp. rT4E-8]|uniref:elongator complex protein 3 n=1 Tax=Ihubacter sp. rT4E-8 TaxID=3242369 RepID=UPI003CF318D4